MSGTRSLTAVQERLETALEVYIELKKDAGDANDRGSQRAQSMLRDLQNFDVRIDDQCYRMAANFLVYGTYGEADDKKNKQFIGGERSHLVRTGIRALINKPIDTLSANIAAFMLPAHTADDIDSFIKKKTKEPCSEIQIIDDLMTQMREAFKKPNNLPGFLTTALYQISYYSQHTKNKTDRGVRRAIELRQALQACTTVDGFEQTYDNFLVTGIMPKADKGILYGTKSPSHTEKGLHLRRMLFTVSPFLVLIRDRLPEEQNVQDFFRIIGKLDFANRKTFYRIIETLFSSDTPSLFIAIDKPKTNQVPTLLLALNGLERRQILGIVEIIAIKLSKKNIQTLIDANLSADNLRTAFACLYGIENSEIVKQKLNNTKAWEMFLNEQAPLFYRKTSGRHVHLFNLPGLTNITAAGNPYKEQLRTWHNLDDSVIHTPDASLNILSSTGEEEYEGGDIEEKGSPPHTPIQDNVVEINNPPLPLSPSARARSGSSVAQIRAVTPPPLHARERSLPTVLTTQTPSSSASVIAVLQNSLANANTTIISSTNTGSPQQNGINSSPSKPIGSLIQNTAKNFDQTATSTTPRSYQIPERRLSSILNVIPITENDTITPPLSENNTSVLSLKK